MKCLVAGSTLMLNYVCKIFNCRVSSWKYNIRRNVISDFSIVMMYRVAIIFFELGKIISCKNFNFKTLRDYLFVKKLCLTAIVSYTNKII